MDWTQWMITQLVPGVMFGAVVAGIWILFESIMKMYLGDGNDSDEWSYENRTAEQLYQVDEQTKGISFAISNRQRVKWWEAMLAVFSMVCFVLVSGVLISFTSMVDANYSVTTKVFGWLYGIDRTSAAMNSTSLRLYSSIPLCVCPVMFMCCAMNIFVIKTAHAELDDEVEFDPDTMAGDVKAQFVKLGVVVVLLIATIVAGVFFVQFVFFSWNRYSKCSAHEAKDLNSKQCFDTVMASCSKCPITSYLGLNDKPDKTGESCLQMVKFAVDENEKRTKKNHCLTSLSDMWKKVEEE